MLEKVMTDAIFAKGKCSLKEGKNTRRKEKTLEERKQGILTEPLKIQHECDSCYSTCLHFHDPTLVSAQSLLHYPMQFSFVTIIMLPLGVCHSKDICWELTQSYIPVAWYTRC